MSARAWALVLTNPFDAAGDRVARKMPTLLGSSIRFCTSTLMLHTLGRRGALAMAIAGEWNEVYSHKSFGATPNGDQSTSLQNLE